MTVYLSCTVNILNYNFTYSIQSKKEYKNTLLQINTFLLHITLMYWEYCMEESGKTINYVMYTQIWDLWFKSQDLYLDSWGHVSNAREGNPEGKN